MRWVLPGPQDPAQTVRRPVICASAAAARRRGLLVVDVHPLDALRAPHGVDDGVEAVADEPVDPCHACLAEHLDDLVGHGLAHVRSSVVRAHHAEALREQVSAVIAPLGLRLSPETRVVHIEVDGASTS